MRKHFFLVFIFCSILSYGQDNRDFVVLKSSDKNSLPDTVFGNILIPQNGIYINAKIETPEGIKRFSPNKVICFKAGKKYFASVPFGNGKVFAMRQIEGPIELYYYSTDSPNDNRGLLEQSLHEGLVSLTSRYYLKSDSISDMIVVPSSSKKFIQNISTIFKDNEDIYDKIVKGFFTSKDIYSLVNLYNSSKR